MNIKTLEPYTSYTQLVTQLTYLHTTNDIYVQMLDREGKNTLYIFYDEASNEYNFYFKLLDELVSENFIKVHQGINFFELQNKKKFLSMLKGKLQTLIEIMQNLGYKFMYTPEVTVSDLEDLDNLFKDDVQVFETVDSVETKKHLNQVLVSHGIMTWTLFKPPYVKDYITKIKVTDLSLEVIELFPETSKYKDIVLTVTNTPNIYFPSITNLKVVKQFTYHETVYQIIFDSMILLQQIGQLAKQYYHKYKLNPSGQNMESYLSLSTKFVEIIKNPYSSNNINPHITKDSVYSKSSCSKCNSRSGMFLLTLGDVKVKMLMGSTVAAVLEGKNILGYKEILELQCRECENIIFENSSKIDEITNKRDYLKGEDWTSSLHQTPVLDNEVAREVIVSYDMITVTAEFDTTDPLFPKIIYDEITSVGVVTGWTEPETNQQKTFYKY